MSISHIPIKINIQSIGEAEGELIRIRSPRTTDAIIKILPIEGMAALWQQEVYFDIPIKMGSLVLYSSASSSPISFILF